MPGPIDPASRRVASTEGPKARLGNKRGLFDPPPPQGGSEGRSWRDLRRTITADQRQAGQLYRAFSSVAVEEGATVDQVQRLAGRGVSLCGWTQIRGMETFLMRVQRGDRLHAFLTGRQMCGLRWVCPVCTAARAEIDRQDVNDGLAAGRETGLWPVMLTLTTRHHRGHDPAALLAAISRAEQRMKEGKVWRRLRAQTGGYVRVLEWTWSRTNGHHPHFHLVLLVRAESEAAAVAAVEALRGRYLGQLDAVGLDGASQAAQAHAFQVQGAAAASRYITKWGVAEELTGAQRKDAGGGLTPWQLLRQSRTLADPDVRAQAAAVWWDIIQATKGRAQLYKSQDWIELVERWRAAQPEETEAPEPEPETVMSLGARVAGDEASPLWFHARRRTLAIREAAESSRCLDTARAAVMDAIAGGPTDAALLDRVEAAEVDPGDLVEAEARESWPQAAQVGHECERQKKEHPFQAQAG